ncbi:MAG: 2-succinyl-5-enolpyruvyl-6-hydroxy-3-cyclohexene-1-carboxylic-acid synthase [Cyclobacteriaceae bacterium]
MARLQPIYDIAEICAHKGIREAVLCPGSRCAPLTSAFVAQPQINTRTFSDERSAGFIANGIALGKDAPVVIVCTSGSAAYNLGPAVAEAFYQQIPTIILTADRPKEWIDQHDGQTIRQANLYGSHVKKYFELPQDYDHKDAVWQVNRTINEAVNLSTQFPKGPVHINVPLREPLYLVAGEGITFSANVRIIESEQGSNTVLDSALTKLKDTFLSQSKVVIVVGQQRLDQELIAELDQFSKQHFAPIIGDVISNLHGLQNCLRYTDAMLGACKTENKKALLPQILITFGKSIISKNLKIFLREFSPKHHWHVQPCGEVADTFQSLTSVINCSPKNFLKQLSSAVPKVGFEAQKRENYFRLWQAEEHRTQRAIESCFSSPQLSEFSLVNEVLKNLPKDCNLHLANSMAVRYANYIGIHETQTGVEIFANRGTSGIDGCSSTAVGHSLANEKPTVLITGDLAFFYDRNAFWHNYPLPNLRVLVLNNHGGAIFSMIEGPSSLPEASEYFITQQRLNAKALTSEFGFDYLKLDNLRKLKNVLKDFFEFDGRTKILEIESTAADAKTAMTEFKNQIRKNYES